MMDDIDKLKFEGVTGAPPDFRDLDGVGDKTARKLERRFDAPTDLQDASLDELTSVPGVGEQRARRIKQRVGGSMFDTSPGGSVEAGNLADALDDTRDAAATVVETATEPFEQLVDLGTQIGDSRERRRDIESAVPFADADEETVKEVARAANVFSEATADPIDPTKDTPDLGFDDEDRERAARVRLGAEDVLVEQHGYDRDDARSAVYAAPDEIDPGIVTEVLPGDTANGNGGERSAPPLVDDRDRQGTLDVGREANVTRDRESKVAGTAEFEDRGSPHGGSNPGDKTTQTGLQTVEETVGAGQMDLTGGEATETVGGEWQDKTSGEERETITLGSVGTATAELPAAVGEFEGDRTSSSKAVYEGPDGMKIRVRHDKTGQHGRRRKYTVSLYDESEDDISAVESVTIDHGPYEDRDLDDAAADVADVLEDLATSRNGSDRGDNGNGVLDDVVGGMIESDDNPLTDDDRDAVETQFKKLREDLAGTPLEDDEEGLAITAVNQVLDDQYYGTGNTQSKVTIEDQTQSVAETAVRWAENRDVLGERVDDDLIDAVKTGELSGEDAAVVETALREYAADQQDRADAGEHSIMGGPDSAEDWAGWAREAADDIGVAGDDAELVRNVREFREAEREPIPATERDPAADLMRRAELHDVSLSPREAFGDAMNDSDPAEPPEDVQEMIAEDLAEAQQDDGPAVVELGLSGAAAEAALQAARWGERESDDLDRETLRAVRGQVAPARSDGGTVQLTDEQRGELSDAIADFGMQTSPAQRPDGLDELEDAVFGIDTDSTDSDDHTDTDPVSDEPDPGRGEKIEFGRIDAAREFRSKHGEVLHPGDVPQSKTVTVDPDADDSVIERAHEDALISHADETDGSYGMERLADDEKQTLKKQYDTWDWQRHGFEAMRAKAALMAQGVASREWTDYYEPGEDWSSSLDKLDETAQQAARTGAKTGVDKRTDEHEVMSRGDIARRLEEARGQAETHAVKHAKKGDEGALEALETEFGWETEEVQRLRDMVADPATPYTSDDIRRIESFERKKTDGRMVSVPTERDRRVDPPGRRSPTSGRLAPPPDRREPPGIARSKRTGRFKEAPDSDSGGGR